MAKSLEQMLKDQIGEMVFALCAKDAELERLREALAKHEQEAQKPANEKLVRLPDKQPVKE